MKSRSFILALALLAGSSIGKPQTTDQNDSHHHEMEQRGTQGMGFSQQTTAHHFLLTKEGGVIQVTANSAEDKASIDHIRMHLEHISRAFKAGDFNIPGFVHDETPPGVPVMIKRRDQINYTYEKIANGGRVVISSKNVEAVDAIQAYLRFQITEHRTGDPLH